MLAVCLRRQGAVLGGLLAAVVVVWAARHQRADREEHKGVQPAPEIHALDFRGVVGFAESKLHVVPIELPAGGCLRLAVVQQGADVVLTLRDSTGSALLESDSPNRSWGPEELWWIAPTEGLLRLEIRPFTSDDGGRYRLSEVSVGPADTTDRIRLRAAQAVARGKRLMMESKPGAARTEFAAARASWSQAGEGLQVALTELRLAPAAAADGDGSAEVAAYRAALDGFRRLSDGRQEVYTLLRLADAVWRSGDPRQAFAYLEEAEALARERGLDGDEAAALNNQARLLEERGEIRAALGRYRQALSVFRRLGDRVQSATVLHNLGAGSAPLGLLDEAEEALIEARGLRRELGDRSGEAATLTELGWVYRLRALAGGEESLLDQAQALLGQALELRRAVGDEAGEAGTLDRLGTVYRDRRLWPAALSCYRRALRLTRRSSPGRNEAHTRTNLAELALERGEFADARRLAASALAIFSRLPAPEPGSEVHARYLLGRAWAGLGEPEEARRELEAALAGTERLRAGLRDQTLTLPFFSLRQVYFEGAVDSLMALDALGPGRGLREAALETNERARMKTLVESLADRRRPERMQDGRAPPGEPPATVAQIQREILDADTQLLEFALGAERGFLWVVGRNELTVHPLPGTRALEPLVRQACKDFSWRSGRGEAAQELAKILLEPVAGRLSAPRLAVVTDDLLARLPFAALPWGPGGRPLAESFEIVRLPSATTLAALRRRSRSTPTGSVAALADPVFSPLDERVGGTRMAAGAPALQAPSELTRSIRDLGLERLPRLPGTRLEADGLRARATGSLVALDFAASRSALYSARVRGSRLLHLASHALVNPKDPAGSGIVLSLVDQEGRPQDGFVRAEEIANLELAADLVVASACKTALGPEIRGEGLMSLARAFLRAGAKGTLVSLWNVEDAASEAFMRHFYDALLGEGLSPAAALRRAQLAVQRDPRWSDPHYWAAYELQGDWR